MEQEIIDKSKVIAEFMGFELNQFENIGGAGYSGDLVGYPKGTSIGLSFSKYGEKKVVINQILEFAQHFKYISSWEWQIPVWRKFLKEVQERRYNGEKKFNDQIEIWEHNYHAAIDVDSVSSGFRILSLAIEWYNNIK